MKMIQSKVIQPQEVWFAKFPFDEDETQSKDRPVIVLAVDDEMCSVLSLKITSTPPYSEFEIELFDWAQIPLSHISTADVSSAKFILKTDFHRKIGKLSDDDWDNVTDLYTRYLQSTGDNI